MDQSNAPGCYAASHKSTNEWYKAFDVVYSNVAADCSIPTGKNRFHKFKEKIVELWNAMETDAPDDHPLKARAVQQLNTYRLVCEEARKAESSSSSKSPSATYTVRTSAKRTTGSGSGTAGTKRSYGSSSSSINSFAPASGRTWKHLDEGSVLGKLPEPLKALVHLRNMGSEIGASKIRVGNLESQYQDALQEYLQQGPGDDAFGRAQTLVVLHRFSHSVREGKEILAAYEQAVSTYVAELDPNPKSTTV